MTSPTLENIDCFYHEGQTYEITLNWPKQYPLSVSRIHNCVQNVSVMMDSMKGVLEYELFPELSEVRNANPEKERLSRWHYHGIIRILDLGEFLLTHINRMQKMCDYQINAFRPDYWPKYIVKQQSVMLPLCKKYHVPYKVSSDKPVYKITVDSTNGNDYFNSLKASQKPLQPSKKVSKKRGSKRKTGLERIQDMEEKLDKPHDDCEFSHSDGLPCCSCYNRK